MCTHLGDVRRLELALSECVPVEAPAAVEGQASNTAGTPGDQDGASRWALVLHAMLPLRPCLSGALGCRTQPATPAHCRRRSLEPGVLLDLGGATAGAAQAAAGGAHQEALDQITKLLHLGAGVVHMFG